MTRWDIFVLRLHCWRVGHRPYRYPSGASACSRCYQRLDTP